MEIEYKWELPCAGTDKTRAQILSSSLFDGVLVTSKVIHMHGVYHDTPDKSLSARRMSLRLRGEDDQTVCCMKLPAGEGAGAAKARREYEVAADDVLSGVAMLRGAGAPADVCAEIMQKGVVVTCETEFVRCACEVQAQEFAAELAFDGGVLRRQGREASLSEVELEFKGGSLEAFHEFARKLQREFGLKDQPLSKLARALAV